MGKTYARHLANLPISTVLSEDKEHNEKEENINSENIYIKGDNLEALRHLVNAYSEKIKLIYIDPPYNTKNGEFTYFDDRKFTEKELDKLIELEVIAEDEKERILLWIDDEASSHSAWLTFMFPRLYLARKLLKDDGLIFISIDDNEAFQLKLLCDEIFSEENFVNNISIEMTPSSGVKRAHKDKMFIKNKESILVYKKMVTNIEPLYDEWEEYDYNYSIYFDQNGIKNLKEIINEKYPLYNKINIEKYLYFSDIKKFIIENRNKIFRRHDASKWAIENVDFGEIVYHDSSKNTRGKVIKVVNPDALSEYEILMEIQKKGGNKGYERLEPISWNYLDENFKKLRGDLWLNYDKDMGNVNKEGEVPYPNAKKPLRLLTDILKATTKDNDIILDFFSGSATTAHAVMQLNFEDKKNRRYIMIQNEERIKRGTSPYTFCEKNNLPFNITSIGIRRIENVIKDFKQKNINYNFKIYSLKPIPNKLKIENNFDPKLDMPFENKILNDDEKNSLLTTYKVFDGYFLNEKIERISLAEYTAYKIKDIVYFIEAIQSSEPQKVFLEKIDKEPDFSIDKIVIYGFSVGEGRYRKELLENIKHYNNRKNAKIEVEVRY